jgi:hypothetical protein
MQIAARERLKRLEAEMLQAMEAIGRFGLGFEDALLWATAQQNNDRCLYTDSSSTCASG